MERIYSKSKKNFAFFASISPKAPIAAMVGLFLFMGALSFNWAEANESANTQQVLEQSFSESILFPTEEANSIHSVQSGKNQASEFKILPSHNSQQIQILWSLQSVSKNFSVQGFELTLRDFSGRQISSQKRIFQKSGERRLAALFPEVDFLPGIYVLEFVEGKKYLAQRISVTD